MDGGTIECVRTSAGAPLVGREEQLSRVREALGRAADGEPSLLLVAGDAGVGKTRLLAQVAGDAAAAGARVVLAHCVDLGEVGIPYLPVTEALTQLRDDPAVTDVVASRPALGRLLDSGTGAETEDRAERLQLLEGVAAALAGAGRPGSPLVLLLEDLHWADPSTRDVLRFLVARLRTEHLLVVASYRQDDLHRQHPLRPLLAELRRHTAVDHVDLPPFSEPELREFTTAVAGTPLAEDAFQQVRRRSEGNAYFAEELVEAGPDGTALPWSLADVLHARLEQLDPAVQRLARVASVSGRVVADDLLRAVVARDVPPDVAEAGYDATLREAVTHHVLVVEDGKVVFRHALLAEAVEADLLPGERATVHRAYLGALVDEPALGSAAQRAHHALQAHDLPTALTASREASRRAARLLAPAEELRHLEQVLSLWAAVPDAAALLGEDRATVALAAASAAHHAGSSHRAVQLARRVVEGTADDPARQAALRHVLARLLVDDERLEEALAEAAAGLAALPEDPPSRDRAWTLAVHARASLNLDRDDDAAASARRAVDAARAAGATDAEAEALTTLAVLEVADAAAARDLLESARALAVEGGDLLTEMRCWYNLAGNRFYAGDLAEADRYLDRGMARARETGVAWTSFGAGLLMLAEITRYMRGDLSPAPSPQGVPADALPLLEGARMYAATARGDDDVLDRAAALRPLWDRDGQLALIAGGCTVDALTAAGRHEEAVTLAEELVAHLGAVWWEFFLGRIWVSALALAALADAAEAARPGDVPPGLLERGDALLAAALETAERGRPRGGSLGPEGRAWLLRARAEHARLRGDADPDLWERTTREFDYGYRYETARSRSRWAQALLASGDRASAEVEAAEALEEARAMGAGPLEAAVRDLARRGRLSLPGVRGTTSPLTEREEEVLALVAHGLSNRQIGERLYISTKTVSVHVSNVLAKLGASGRAEAVSVAHRRGLLEV